MLRSWINAYYKYNYKRKIDNYADKDSAGNIIIDTYATKDSIPTKISQLEMIKI